MPLVGVLEFLDWSSVVNSIVNVAYSVNVQLDWMDAFNGAKIFGKFLKLLFQLYMKGFLSKRRLVKAFHLESPVDI